MTKKSILFLSILTLTAVAVTGGVLWYSNTTQEQIEVAQKEVEEAKKQEMELQKQEQNIDTSDWKTYRNEEIGFEFKLPNEYSIPENSYFVKKTQDDIFLIVPNLTEYRFNSRAGMVAISEAKNQGVPITDALIDTSAIRLKVYPKIQSFHNNFAEWVLQNIKTSFTRSGEMQLSSGIVVKYVIWNSICEDSSAFFEKDAYILEINTCASTFLYQGDQDYFSSMLNSVKFIK